MGTKANTTSTNQYNANSLNDYQTLATQSGAQLGSQISNPYNNSVINNQRQLVAPMVAGQNRMAATNSANQMGALGTSGGARFSSGAASDVTRFNAGTSGQATNNLLLGAANNRNTALGAAMAFRPLQTGGKQVQSTSGLGTWLGAAIGTAGAGLSAYKAAGSDSTVPNGNDQNGMTSYAQPGGEEGQFSGGTGTLPLAQVPSTEDAMGWGGNEANLTGSVVPGQDELDDEGGW